MTGCLVPGLAGPQAVAQWDQLQKIAAPRAPSSENLIKLCWEPPGFWTRLSCRESFVHVPRPCPVHRCHLENQATKSIQQAGE